MGERIRQRAADAFRSAFSVEPEAAQEQEAGSGLGVYAWNTPPIEQFSLPGTDELIVALHLGGARHVRAINGDTLSRAFSSPGLVTLLPPHQASAFHTGGGVSLLTIHVTKSGSGDARDRYVERLAALKGPRFAFRDAFVRASMEALLRVLRSGHSLQADDYLGKVADALLCHLSLLGEETSLVTEPTRLTTDQALGNTSLAALLKYVDQRLGTKLSLDDLACKAGVSRAYFARTFKSGLGISLHQYLNHRRIDMARKLLRDSEMDLAQIAYELGFASQSHFTEAFRTQVGNTPLQFRRDVGAKVATRPVPSLRGR
jgi:AraC family transcriptional regulator